MTTPPAPDGSRTVRLHWEGAGEPCESEPSTGVAAAAGGPPPIGGRRPTGRLDAALLEAASRHPDRTATAGSGGTRTYGQLAAGALTVARFLERHPGWRPGDRVGLVLDSGPIYTAAFHGVLLAGGVAVPIPPTLPPERIGELLEWTNCALRFEDGSGADGNGPRLGLPVAFDPPLPRPEAGARDDLAAILLTSGSTGPPKGVMLSRGNLYSNADAIRGSRLRLRAADRALVTLPVHHAFGNSVLQSHLLAGSCLVFDPDERSPLAAIARHRITALYEVPDRCVLLERLLRRRKMPESLRFLAVAGGRLAPRLALGLADALAPAELVIMYGQTEATARLTCLDPARLRDAPDSIGRPIPGVEIEVVDDAGRAVDPGETGTLRARGPGTCLGYWRDPAATREILEGGWLRTNDRGSVDADGLLYHRGRADEIVKLAGRRVDLGRLCREVESVVGAPNSAAVLFETAEGAQRLGLFVRGPESLRDRVLAWCRDTLARDERPAVVEMIDSLPRSSSGKVDTEELAELARRAWSGEAGSRSTPLEGGA